MKYDKELEFVQKLLNKFRLNMRYVNAPHMMEPLLDVSLDVMFHALLKLEVNTQNSFQILQSFCKTNTIYRLHDRFRCNYILFQLPDSEPVTYVTIGPYILEELPKNYLLELAQEYSLPPETYTQIEKYYLDLPFVANEQTLLTILYTLGEYLWGDVDNFSLQDSNDLLDVIWESITSAPKISEPVEPALTMQTMEERYGVEKALFHAVSSGQIHKAEMALNTLGARQYEQRTADPIRNLKNYTIILNTLLRKAAEAGAVHPIHIDTLSSRYARKIELIHTEAAAMALQKEMIHKYCLLVTNHSLKGYSLLVRKVLTRIDTDLTADLTLKTQAELLNVNPSYLSTLFKKETGSTLTEYVNRKRIEHAIFLLNSTDMQIQLIAQYCGFPDVNYFTKTFKKHVGKTPKEYRDTIVPHK